MVVANRKSFRYQISGDVGRVVSPCRYGYRATCAVAIPENAYMRSWNSNPTAFEWTKPAGAIIRSHRRMLDRISRAVH